MGAKTRKCTTSIEDPLLRDRGRGREEERGAMVVGQVSFCFLLRVGRKTFACPTHWIDISDKPSRHLDRVLRMTVDESADEQ